MPNLYFDKVKLVDGTLAEVCDAVARAAMQGGTYFLGITTTALYDGATTNPITISGESVSVNNGNVVAYENKEFVFSSMDNKWHELGDLTNLGSLALQDTASTYYTPDGTISKPNVSVTCTTKTVKEFDSAGSVTAGTANVPTAVTLPTLATTLNGTTLELNWTTGSVTAGTANVPTAVTLPTSKNTEVVSDASAELSAAPEFTGTQALITVS